MRPLVRQIIPISVALILGSALRAQNPTTVAQLPRSLIGFRLSDSTRFADGGGASFRYLDSSKAQADVYLYPVSSPRLASDSATLASEARAFIAGLAYGPERGWYEAYDVVIDTLRLVATDLGQVPVRVVVYAFRRSTSTYVSFTHLALVNDDFLKVRLTLPSRVWSTSMAPNFALDLIKVLNSKATPPN